MSKNTYYESVHEIIRAGHRITDGINRQLKKFGSTEPQYNVLQILSGTGGRALTINEIQNDMVQRNSNVSRIVDKLLAGGLVTRTECRENRRKKDILITQRGSEYLKELNTIVDGYHAPMKQRLSDEELNSLKELIRTLIGG